MRLLTRWTSADLLALPQDWGLRYEILDGELYAAMHPSVHHQAVCTEVTVTLGRWEESSSLGLTLPAPGIVLSTGDEVIPDVIWISAARMHGAVDADGHFTRMPELVVEKSSLRDWPTSTATGW